MTHDEVESLTAAMMKKITKFLVYSYSSNVQDGQATWIPVVHSSTVLITYMSAYHAVSEPSKPGIVMIVF